MKRTGIFIEIANGKIKNATYGMITAAREEGIELYAFVINFEAEKIREQLKNYGIHKIVEIRYEPFSNGTWNNPVSWSESLIKAMNAFNIHILLGLTNSMGKELLPRMAAELDAPLIMDCIDIDFEKNIAKTFNYSGKTIASVKVNGDYLFFGIKPNIIEAVPLAGAAAARLETEIIPLALNINTSEKIRLLETKAPDASTLNEFSAMNLMEADVIISGGRGMKNRDNFKILSECAEKLGAAVGASRVAVDSGWVPYSMQVGQTGEKVSPRVYIACGISGSIQHFAGMKTANMIIAVNIDLKAPIISLCDYYVAMDLFEIIPLLTMMLDNRGKD